jgi:uncharacterized surface protein with fasciclin (FAS1) repeats
MGPHLIGAIEMTTDTSTMTIVDVAVGSGRTSTLVAAIKAAGLVDTLSSAGPFTVFAPVDEAFAALPPGTLESVLADKAMLTRILTYHVVSGHYLASDVLGLDSVKTVEGGSLPIVVDSGGVHVGSAKVLATDIESSNGVIHLIDSVLMPES